MMARQYENFSNLELADYIQRRNILDDGIPDHIREALLRMLWYYQAQVPPKRIDWGDDANQQLTNTSRG